MKLDGCYINMDPGRRIFKARFRKYRVLNDRETIGNYYINCALMLDPSNMAQRKLKLSAKKKSELMSQTRQYVKLGRKYYPNSIRLEWLPKISEFSLDFIAIPSKS